MKRKCEHRNEAGYDTGLFTYIMCIDCKETVEIRNTARVDR